MFHLIFVSLLEFFFAFCYFCFCYEAFCIDLDKKLEMLQTAFKDTRVFKQTDSINTVNIHLALFFSILYIREEKKNNELNFRG